MSVQCLYNALSHRFWILDGSVWSHELDSMILMDPFQLEIFCGSRVGWWLALLISEVFSSLNNSLIL